MKRKFYHCPMRKLYDLFLGKGLGSKINEAFTYKNRGICLLRACESPPPTPPDVRGLS